MTISLQAHSLFECTTYVHVNDIFYTNKDIHLRKSTCGILTNSISIANTILSSALV